MNPHMRVKVHIPPFQSYSKLVVSHQAWTNNRSKYTMKGRASACYEVQTLLKGRIIDLHGKRIIFFRYVYHQSLNRVQSSQLRK